MSDIEIARILFWLLVLAIIERGFHTIITDKENKKRFLSFACYFKGHIMPIAGKSHWCKRCGKTLTW